MSTLAHTTDASFATDTASGLVLVDFWAEWCGPCKAMLPNLESFAADESRVKVLKCNVDENNETPMSFRVMSIPTLVLMKDGKPVASTVGVKSVADLKSWVAPHLG